MRGSLLDMIVIMVALFVTSITLIFSYYILDQFGDYATNSTLMTKPMNATYFDQGKQALLVYDSVFLFITVAFAIASVIGAFMIRSHPLFFGVSFLFLIVCIFIGAILTNIFWEIAQVAPLNSAAELMTNMLLIMQRLPIVVLAIGLMIMIALFAKLRRGSGEGI